MGEIVPLLFFYKDRFVIKKTPTKGDTQLNKETENKTYGIRIY